MKKMVQVRSLQSVDSGVRYIDYEDEPKRWAWLPRLHLSRQQMVILAWAILVSGVAAALFLAALIIDAMREPVDSVLFILAHVFG